MVKRAFWQYETKPFTVQFFGYAAEKGVTVIATGVNP